MEALPEEEDKLETAISLVLIGGVILSLILESYGLFLYHHLSGKTAILYTPQWRMDGTNFFTYIAHLFRNLASGGGSPVDWMALGIVTLMLTPYIRVVAAVGFYAVKKDWKYLFITLFVLTVLTGSLAIH